MHLPAGRASVYRRSMQQPSASDSQTSIRRGRKFEQVLAGAREVFMSDGFERGSVEDIARRAGVSKATLYSYFPDKRLLFVEVVRGECARQADSALELSDMTSPPEEVLRRAALRTIDFYLSEFGQAMHRICVAESGRFPELGRHFYRSGPEMARERLVGYLEGACARGVLSIDDMALAADQFIELCKADLFARAACNVLADAGPDRRERVADGAVAMFMARYGTKP